jgi:hypothetical protein
MKLKLAVINNSLPVIQELAKTKFSPKVAYKLGRLINSLDSHYTDINKQHIAILTKYGAKPSGDMLLIEQYITESVVVDGKETKKPIEPLTQTESFIAYKKEYDDFLSLEIELDIKFPIDLEEINDAKLTPAQTLSIESFIKQD